MKKIRKLVTSLLCGAIVATSIGASATTTTNVFAATEASVTKTATLNNAQISFDGKAPVTVQCYNIDGSNYVRVREIVAPFNFDIAPMYDGVGVLIKPYSTYKDGGKMEKLTEQTISVQVVTGYVFYAGLSFEAQCFNYADRYYFKLADIGAASKNTLSIKEKNAIDSGKSEFGRTPNEPLFYSLNVQWDEATRTININKVTTDLKKLFDDARGVSPVVDPQPTTPTPNPQPVTEPQPALTSPPKEGAILANVLKDPSKGAYLDGKPYWDNINTAYHTYSAPFGQCTWYAFGRFHEVNAMNISKTINNSGAGSMSGFVSNALSGKYEGLDAVIGISNPQVRSIGVWSGHVLFIEYVEYDSSGNVKNVFISEGNNQNDGSYKPDNDGKVKKWTLDYLKQLPGTFYGYVFVK